ncbi:MAG: asparagine synthase (glutamine-hydrolyzing) [Acidobacteria bacterium]|nr:asparagine synthase (glutamine-hydrolyzing) [Acidobacteriota bacterium]MBI3655110.1 asparagine synthase (glutamine-hydrolyzing) [Acidobacteriota bacterium]
MCGIAGILTENQGHDPVYQAAAQKMVQALVHRGPDHGGLYHDGHILLGSRRLSIVDLSTAATQPMTNENEDLWIVFNGEIYNFRELRAQLLSRGHRFRSATDTEVILHLYEDHGEECLKYLRGMFAFALWNKRTRRLFLARDRSGIKPLYYCRTQDLLLFASEIKGLLASGLVSREIDPHAIGGFLAFGSVPSPATGIWGISSIPPGHFMMVKGGDMPLKKYWDLRPTLVRNSPVDDQGIVSETRARLEEATRLHMESDVPLGIFLSGGMDSSALVALATLSAPAQKLKTLSIIFREAAYNEAKYAQLIARKYETDHCETVVGAKDFIQELPNIFQAMDQPTNDGINTYFVSKAAQQAGLKVVLSGLGGDELFWGYSHYRKLARLENCIAWYSKQSLAVRTFLLESILKLNKIARRPSLAKLRYLKHPSMKHLYMAVRGMFSPDQISALLQVSYDQWSAGIGETDEPPAGDLPARFSYLEMKRYLHDQLLRDTDFMSMACSIEVRVPFLDHELMEHVAQTESRLKLSPQVNKILLARAMGGLLPEEIVRRPKMGFTFPLAEWIRIYRKELMEISLQGQILDGKTIRSIWDSFLKGQEHWSRPWSLVVINQWLNTMRAGDSDLRHQTSGRQLQPLSKEMGAG